jgi:hypothetical protein
MKISRHTLAQIIVTIAQMTIGTVPAHAAAPERMAITSAHMTTALVTAGVHVTPDQLQPLSLMTATQLNPKLTATKIESLDANTTKVRMQCERTNVCLPFYVLIHWPEADQAKQALKDTPQSRHILLEPLMVRNGKDATLIFEGRNMHMSMPVLCLQNGVRGQHVRVISKDRKKIFLARVTGPGTLTSAVFNQ